MGKNLFNPNDFAKENEKQSHWQKYWKLYCSFGGLVAACIVGTMLFLPKNEEEVLPPPTPADTLTQVDDTPSVEDIDSATSVEKTTPVNEGVETKQDEVSTETPEVTEKPKANTVTQPTPAGNSRSGDITVDAKKAIRGDFGNGAERRKLLGDDYEQVQALVNKMYRDGDLYW